MFGLFRKKEDICTKVVNQVELIKNMISTGVDYETYLTEGRVVLNLLLIKGITGGEFTQKKSGEYAIRLGDEPSVYQISQITKLLNDFIKNVENPYIASLQEDDFDDIDIPVDSNYLNTLKKSKELSNAIFGYNGKKALSAELLTVMDLLNISAAAESIRVHTARKFYIGMLIVDVAIIAAVVAISIAADKKKKNQEMIEVDDYPDEDIDNDDIIVDEDIDVDDDIPSVDID